MTDTLRALLEPRTLLIGMMAIGAAFLAYIVLAATVPTEKPWEEAVAPLLSGSVERFEPTAFPRRAPDVLLQTPDGQGPVLSELTGGPGVTLVNLWATWCAPCLTEMPELAELAEAEGISVLPVAMQRADEAVARALAEAGLADAAPLANPDLSLMGAYGRDLALPLTVIYDRRGYEVGRIEGAVAWTSPEAVRLVTAIRDGAPEF